MQWLYKSMLEIYPPRPPKERSADCSSRTATLPRLHLMADNADRPWGSAFVTMDTYGAGKAITALHKKEVDGQNITVHIRLV